MPYFMIETNRPLDAARTAAVARRASARVAALVGKDERWVMVSVRPDTTMLFAGSDAPCAYLRLTSIGLAASDGEALSAALCRFAADELAVPEDRVYLELSGPDPALWGWNGGTFG